MTELDPYYYEVIKDLFGEKTASKIDGKIERPECHISFDFNYGVYEENGLKKAKVVSLALLTNPDQKVYYLLKWNSPESAPAGNHLGQADYDYSGRFVEDKSAEGKIITDPNAPDSIAFFNNGYTFFFNDTIAQPKLTGKWTFMILVTSPDGTEILAKDYIDLCWD